MTDTAKRSLLQTILYYLPIAIIMFVFVQSLFFKFTSAPEAIHIFQTIENWLVGFMPALSFFEPVMRYVIGSAELLAALLLISPKTRLLGALLAFGVMVGAIFFHLVSPLGVVVQNDGGSLFMMACAVLICSSILLRRHRKI